MEREDVPLRASVAGNELSSRLEEIPAVVGVRGLGLLLGVELREGFDARVVSTELLGRGLVVNAVTPTALRLTPSLLVSNSEIDEAVTLIDEVLAP
jgi:acetylornithine aminotransferase